MAVCALLACLLGACSNEGGGGLGLASATPPPDTESIEFALGDFPDAQVDVTTLVEDAATSTPIDSQSFPLQTLPFSYTFTMSPVPVKVTMTVTFHLLPARAMQAGTNTGGGTTLTDLVLGFYSVYLPAFVVDNPSAVGTISDVVARAATDLTLATPFPSGPYYVYQTGQLHGTITQTYVGVHSVPVLARDNTTSTVTFQTSF